MRKNVSGQYVYFGMISALSGTPLIGLSGMISGRKSLDGLSGLIVLSGNIIELGGGSYRANLFDFDTNGNQGGYFFSAPSGAVPVQYQFDMLDGNGSGAVFLASGSVTSGLIASGIVFPASGAFVSVPIASISGAIANSGLFVSVLPANLSGVSAIATLYSGAANSGQTVQAYSGFNAVVPISTLSGVVANSGLNVNADLIRWKTKTPRDLVASGHVDAFPAINAGTVRSGTANTIQLLTTAGEGTSGILDGCVVTIVEGTAKGQSRVIRNWGSSGIALIDPPWDVVPEASTEFYIVTPTTRTASGTEFVSLPKAALSGVIANSGIFASVPSGSITSGVICSGVFVTATASVDKDAISGVFASVPISSISGVIANSGLFVTATATVESGLSVIATLYSGALNSGQTVQSYSGAHAVVPKETLSGLVANSGLFVSVLPANLSGVVANSGLTVSLASGSAYVNSGFFADALRHNFSGLSVASGVRCLLNAERKLINKWDLTANSGYLTVYAENDSDEAYKQAVTSASGAEPVTGLDT
jgi:hypothetical protein